jgi:hypothetical protein
MSLIWETAFGVGWGMYTLQKKKKAKIKADFKNGKKDEYLRKLETPKFLIYYNQYLGRVLKFLSDNFGPPFSNSSNNFTTNLAVFYSFAAFFGIWVFSGVGKMGNVTILDENINPRLRFLYFIISIIFIIISYLLLDDKYKGPLKRDKRIVYFLYVLVFIPYFAVAILLPSNWIYHTDLNGAIKSLLIILFASSLGGFILNRAFTNKSGSVIFAITFIILVFGSSVASTLIQFTQDPIKFLIMLGTTLFLSYSVYFIQKKYDAQYVYFVNLIMVSSYVIIIRYFPSILGVDIISAILLYFFVLMPSLNGVMDWISLSIGRILAKIIIRNNDLTTLIILVFVDLIVALILLCSLVIVFITGTKVFNYLLVHNEGFKIPIDKLIESTKHSPFTGSGLWVSIMLFSTLIPTVFHFFIANNALTKYGFKGLRNYLAKKIKLRRVSSWTYNLFAWYLITVPSVGLLITIAIAGGLVYLVVPYFSQLIYSVAIYSATLFNF